MRTEGSVSLIAPHDHEVVPANRPTKLARHHGEDPGEGVRFRPPTELPAKESGKGPGNSREARARKPG